MRSNPLLKTLMKLTLEELAVILMFLVVLK